MKRLLVLALAIYTMIPACAADVTPTTVSVPTRALSTPVPAPLPTATQTRRPKPISPITPIPTSTSMVTSVPGVATADALDWKSWPVIPETIDTSLQKVYERGLALGNDPHSFSIFGDCQARPGEFFGMFETDLELVESLPPELRETIEYFHGSFNRESPTAQDGTTPGALFWNQWHRGEYGCSLAETPVECELRIHRPRS